MLSKERIEELRKTIALTGETSVEFHKDDFENNFAEIVQKLTYILTNYQRPNRVYCYRYDEYDDDFEVTFYFPKTKTPEDIEHELKRLIRLEEEKIDQASYTEQREKQELKRLMMKYPNIVSEENK